MDVYKFKICKLGREFRSDSEQMKNRYANVYIFSLKGGTTIFYYDNDKKGTI